MRFPTHRHQKIKQMIDKNIIQTNNHPAFPNGGNAVVKKSPFVFRCIVTHSNYPALFNDY